MVSVMAEFSLEARLWLDQHPISYHFSADLYLLSFTPNFPGPNVSDKGNFEDFRTVHIPRS